MLLYVKVRDNSNWKREHFHDINIMEMFIEINIYHEMFMFGVTIIVVYFIRMLSGSGLLEIFIH